MTKVSSFRSNTTASFFCRFCFLRHFLLSYTILSYSNRRQNALRFQNIRRNINKTLYPRCYFRKYRLDFLIFPSRHICKSNYLTHANYLWALNNCTLLESHLFFRKKTHEKQPLPQNNQDKNLEKTHYSHLFKRFPPQSSFSYGTITHVQTITNMKTITQTHNITQIQGYKMTIRNLAVAASLYPKTWKHQTRKPP